MKSIIITLALFIAPVCAFAQTPIESKTNTEEKIIYLVVNLYSENSNLNKIQSYLDKGWKVKHLSTSGDSGSRSVIVVVLERQK